MNKCMITQVRLRIALARAAILWRLVYSCESSNAAECKTPLLESEEGMLRYDELYEGLYNENVE